jgi:hypothetical protein
MAVFLAAIAFQLAVYAYIVFDIYRPYKPPEDE